MGTNSNISWTDDTWNPVYGCSRVSEGCRNCYAESVVAGLAKKMAHNPKAHAFFSDLTHQTPSGPRWTGVVKLHTERLGDPLRRRKGRRIFVNSLSDLFHANLSFEEIAAVFGVMSMAPQHTFQVLTKRPENMLRWFTELRQRAEAAQKDVFRSDDLAWIQNHIVRAAAIRHGVEGRTVPLSVWPLPNVWLGVSVENQDAANARVPYLLLTPAAKRWLSMEPLLGSVYLEEFRDSYPKRPVEFELVCTRKWSDFAWPDWVPA